MKIGSKGKIISLDANNEIIEWKFNTVNISIKIKDLKDQVSFRTNIIYVSHKALFFICVVIIICIVAMIFYVRKVYRRNPSKYLVDYLEAQGTVLPKGFVREEYDATPSEEEQVVNTADQPQVQQQPVQKPENEILFE